MASHAAPNQRHVRKRSRRLVQVLSLTTAAVLIPVAAVAATTSSDTGSASSSLDLSPNPVLSSSSQGYSIQEGGSGLTRVAVSDHVAASWAAQVTSSATTTRVREPKATVRPGETWTFASDVKATKSGAKAQITVSWYNSSGAFLSWTGGKAQPVQSSAWTRVAAALPVPAGAASAETVVNVLGTARSSTVQMTQHDVRAPATSGSTSTSTTAPSTSTTTSTSTTSSPATSTSSPATSTSSPTTATSAGSTTTSSTSTTTAPTSTTSTSTSTSSSPTGTVTNLPAQAAGIFYGSTSGATAYAHPGGLVIAGRSNYQDSAFKSVSAGGGTVLIYLDTIIDNKTGRYHDMLINASSCGAAVPRWPGNVQANSYGYLNDFRVGSVLQSKLKCVLETMVAENPHMAGWFADDLGSRSWFPGFDWNSFPDKAGYRAGAIALTQTFRQVADEHGLIFLVNGTWTANDGGGYPTASTSGSALADGGFVEHHDGQIAFFGPYGCSSQWAAQSSVTKGKAINYAVTNSSSGQQEYVNSNCYAYVHQQSDYNSGPAPWGSFHPTGLPSRVTR